jgi:Domain of unknown function (DUF6265)
MNRMRLYIAAISILGLSLIGLAHQPGAATDLSELSWLAGHWTGVQDGLEMEESWLEVKGNSMLGVHRDVKNNHTVSFEFLRIDTSADGITYWASPGGRPPTPFRLKESNGKRVVFENPQHDFPQRIIYWLDGADSLHAKIEGTYQSKPAAEEWTWKRSPR